MWCMMQQNTGAWREVSSVLFHPSFHVVRIRRHPLSPVARGQKADFQLHLTSQLMHVWGKLEGTFVQNVDDLVEWRFSL